MLNDKPRVLIVLFLCITLLSAVIHPLSSLPVIARGDNFTGANIQRQDSSLAASSADISVPTSAEARANAGNPARAFTKTGARNQHRQLRTVYAETEPGGTQPSVYIVQLVDAPLATYRGELANLRATSPKVAGARKLDVTNAASTSYRAYLAQRRTDFRRVARGRIRPRLDNSLRI